ncbi:MAG: prolyl oligopeptidase family serine peptidase [Pyrinomonadaceae bacterium]|nr:prolyl oligopeptidase family serine peptidase [Pyrinomonadaceae bacterium]
MRRKTLTLIFGLIFTSLSLSCVYGQARTPRHLIKKTIKIGKYDRTYHLFVPKGVSKNRDLPLVFVLHGGGGTGLRMERWLGFTALARKDKFIAVYPDGIGKNWNDGRETNRSRAHRENIDDLAFVKEMVDEISRTYNVDENRIFATGPSNGGFFSNFVAAQMSDTFAAIAPVIGGIADPFYKRFDPSEPVSVFFIQGTADPLVPYNGGTVARNRGKLISTDRAIGLWNKANGTNKRPVRGDLPDTNRRDGCKVETYTWKNGRNQTEVVLYKAVGGGHTWPGASQYAPKFLIGGVCRDFDATKAVWEFFKSHPKIERKPVARK